MFYIIRVKCTVTLCLRSCLSLTSTVSVRLFELEPAELSLVPECLLQAHIMSEEWFGVRAWLFRAKIALWKCGTRELQKLQQMWQFIYNEMTISTSYLPILCLFCWKCLWSCNLTILVNYKCCFKFVINAAILSGYWDSLPSMCLEKYDILEVHLCEAK